MSRIRPLSWKCGNSLKRVVVLLLAEEREERCRFFLLSY
jgi:hypothetical protein